MVISFMAQNGSSAQKRITDIIPKDTVEICEGKLKGHIYVYRNVGGSGKALLGEFEVKIRPFYPNHHAGQQVCAFFFGASLFLVGTDEIFFDLQIVESVSHPLEDLKSGCSER